MRNTDKRKPETVAEGKTGWLSRYHFSFPRTAGDEPLWCNHVILHTKRGIDRDEEWEH